MSEDKKQYSLLKRPESIAAGDKLLHNISGVSMQTTPVKILHR